MLDEPEFTKGQKGYLKRFVNLFKNESQVALDNFNSNAKKSITDFEKVKKKVSDELAEIEKKLSTLEEKESSLDIKLNEVSEFSTTIFDGDEEGNIISEEIEGFVEEFVEYKKEIDTLKEEIEKYRDELFGYEDDEGNIINGINHKIDSLKKQLQESIKESQTKLDNFVKENGNKQEELFIKIESLLKGASTVALAKAFNEHKESFNVSNYIWLSLFVTSIFSMMFLSVWGFINANYEFKDMWKYTLGNLPFIGGAIWLAIYSSKQRSQNKRLQQEYAFKEDVAKIYYGLKQEIEELGNSDLGIKLNSKMLETIISVVEDNPSKTLDNNSHNDKGPILEGIKNIVDLVNKNQLSK